MLHASNRWSKDKTVDLQSAIFNGVGHALAWENVWGSWNGITPRGSALMTRVAAVQRYFQPLMVPHRECARVTRCLTQ
jgi:iron(II)-dependent oxidoreductase